MAMKHLAGLAVAAALISTQAQAKTEVEWWHAMGGALGKRSTKLPQTLTQANQNTRSSRFTKAATQKP